MHFEFSFLFGRILRAAKLRCHIFLGKHHQKFVVQANQVNKIQAYCLPAGKIKTRQERISGLDLSLEFTVQGISDYHVKLAPAQEMVLCKY